MIFYQNWSKGCFEERYLRKIKNRIKENPKLKCYIGFDFGFFRGVNIYYGSNYSDEAAKKIYEQFTKYNIPVRLFTNIDYDFDIIILLGYSNLIIEKISLLINKRKIMKALSFF
jgi:hypothetical protein